MSNIALSALPTLGQVFVSRTTFQGQSMIRLKDSQRVGLSTDPVATTTPNSRHTSVRLPNLLERFNIHTILPYDLWESKIAHYQPPDKRELARTCPHCLSLSMLPEPHWREGRPESFFSGWLVNAVSVGCPPVLVMAVPMVGIRCAGIPATVRCCMFAPATIRAACRRTACHAARFRVCFCPIRGSICISGGQRWHHAKQSQRSGNSFHGLSTPFFRDTMVIADSP